MKHIYICSLSLVFLLALMSTAPAAQHQITNAGFSFSPANITIAVGDTVNFVLDPIHNAVEVSQATWNANGNTPNNGFSVGFGGGTVVFALAGTYYYVCAPHASSGMKGIINVVAFGISTGTITPANLCKGASVNVPFTANGTYNPANVFTAQLSNASGSFAAPTSIGTLGGTTSGQIAATVPPGAATGSGYRIRVVSSSPAVTGTDNGSDLGILDVPTASITPNGPTTFCEGLSVVLDAPTGTGLSYIWRRNGIVIGGATASSYTATLAGQYSVEVSNGSCSATSGNTRVIVHPADPTTLSWTGAVNSDWATVGNWDNPCAVPSAGDTVIITGPASPPASVPAIALDKLTVNHAGGLSLAGDLQIAGNLTLTNGTVTLGSANLIIQSTASITGGSAASFIVTDGSGRLQQAGIGSGARAGAVLFPVGRAAGSYTPLTLNNAGAPDQFSVGVANDVLADGNSGTPLGSDVVGRTWFLSESTAGGSNASITFQWSAGDERPSFNRALCYVAHHDGAAWQPVQNIGAATGSDPYFRTVNGVTSFSPFAIGDGDSPLPVEYRTLSTEIRDGAVALLWETEREINSRGYDVERGTSAAGPWTALRFIDSRGNAQHGAAYEFVDRPPVAGTWYYRLRQVDMDGAHEYSAVLRADVGRPERGLAIESAWPNPLRLSAAAEAGVVFRSPESGRAVLTLCNILGQRVAMLFDGAVEAGSSTTVRFSAAHLPPGVYLYRLERGARTVHHRMVVVR
jgi:plastocyanin